MKFDSKSILIALLIISIFCVSVALISCDNRVNTPQHNNTAESTFDSSEDCINSTGGDTEENTFGETLENTESFETEHQHDFELVEGRLPTCTEDGITDGEICRTCGFESIKQEVIKATGHNEIVLDSREATCIEVGLTEGKQCLECGIVTLPQEEITGSHNMPAYTFHCEYCGGVYISNAEELKMLADIVNREYGNTSFYGETVYLLADIDLSGVEWTPIGYDYSHAFQGVFEGNGHVISNFKISTECNNAGLFGQVAYGGILNLGVTDFVIDVNVQNSYECSAGGLVAVLIDSSAENCYAKGEVSISGASYTCAGVLLGRSGISDNYIIKDCYAEGKATAHLNKEKISAQSSEHACAGVLIGCHVYGKIENCHSAGAAHAISDKQRNAYAGGLIGYATEELKSLHSSAHASAFSLSGEAFAGGLTGSCTYDIENCYATGNVVSESLSDDNLNGSYAGGLVGFSHANKVSHSYATGKVIAKKSNKYCAYAGGLIGFNSLYDARGDLIEYCYATGDVSIISDYSGYSGGLIGYTYNRRIENCYATGNVDTKAKFFATGGLVGLWKSGDILKCYSTGNVTFTSNIFEENVSGNNGAGGLVGYVGYIEEGTHLYITSCFAIGNVSGEVTGAGIGENPVHRPSLTIGGLIGKYYNETTERLQIINSYRAEQQSISAEFDGSPEKFVINCYGTPKALSELQSEDFQKNTLGFD